MGPVTCMYKCAEEKNLLAPRQVQPSNCPAYSKPLHRVGYSVLGRVDTLCAYLKTDGVSLSNILQNTFFWDVALCSLETGGCGSYFTLNMEAAGLGGVLLPMYTVWHPRRM